MKSDAATILKHGWIYTVANLVNRAAGLLLLPLYAKVLSASEFGVYALIGVAGDILAVMLMIGIINAFTVIYFEHPDDAGRARVVSSTMLGLWAAALGLLLLAWPAGWGFSLGLFGDGSQSNVVAMAMAGTAMSTVFELTLAYYRVRKRSLACLLISVGKAVALLGLNLMFLLYFTLGVTGIFLANAVTFSVLGLGLSVAILMENGVSFAPDVLKRLMRLGLPFLPQTLLDIGNQFATRYVLNLLMTVAAVGVFSFGMRLATMLYMLLTMSFLQIWSVSRIEAGHGAAEQEQSEFVFHVFLIVLAAAALGMALTAPELLWLVASDDYGSVVACMPFLVLTYVLHGVRMHPEVALVKAKRTKVLPLISLGGLAVGAALTAALVWLWGLPGAAVAVLGREVFMLVVTELACRRFCPDDRPLGVARVLGVLALLVAAYGVGLELFGTIVVPAYTVAKVGLTALFIALAVLGPGISKTERAMLLHLLGQRLRRPQPAS